MFFYNKLKMYVLVAKMEVWGALVFLAIAVSAANTETDVTFPEIARERSRASGRIVSGWEAAPAQLPYQISLRMVTPVGGVVSCGGSILNENWGLTAAHCTANRVTIIVRAGVVNLTLPNTIFETTKYYNHPLYDESNPATVQPHDIGLLEFSRTLVFSDVIQPIRLQRSSARNANFDGLRLIASGWGLTWTNTASPENLNWVYLLGDSNERCFNQYPSIVVPSTICASAYNVSSQSTCQGDSGGPLTVIDEDGRISLIGVSSFVSGTGCHTPFPAGFIRPGHYHDWFTEVTGGVVFDWEYEEEIECEDDEEDDGCVDEDDDDDILVHFA